MILRSSARAAPLRLLGSLKSRDIDLLDSRDHLAFPPVPGHDDGWWTMREFKKCEWRLADAISTVVSQFYQSAVFMLLSGLVSLLFLAPACANAEIACLAFHQSQGRVSSNR